MPRGRLKVVLLTGPGTLGPVVEALRGEGAAVTRLVMVEPEPLPPARWRPPLSSIGAIDDVVVTSRSGVTAGVVPWREAGRRALRVRYWSSGPATAKALRSVGVTNVREPPGLGGAAIVRGIGPGRRRILRLRSDKAGSALARALRARGHVVTDVVVYRTKLRPRIGPSDRARLGGADVIVATSPSAVRALVAVLDPPTLARLTRRVRAVVIGSRSARAARKAGFVRVSVAPSLTAQRFTRHFLHGEWDERPPHR